MKWDKIRKIDSSDQNVFKFVFESKDAVAESVLYRYPDFNSRTVICCSTMSGCPIGCRFCGAGDGYVRPLTSEEIVSQVRHLMNSMNINHSEVKRFQIMFMSMGEPMLNMKQLGAAIITLSQLYPRAALLVSTSAPKVDYEPFVHLSKYIKQIGLQFSVHESTDTARNELIPFKAKLTLQEIANVGTYWHSATGRKPFFNYCVHERNNTNEDIERLYGLFDPEVWEATISVICERDESIAAANRRQKELASDFMNRLLSKGFSVRMFDPAGQDDIGGGCGQLWFVQDWMQKNSHMVRKSVGFGKPKLHTPKELEAQR